MHTHFGIMVGLHAFLSVLIFGTAWRLSAAHLAVSPNPTLQKVAGAMAFQY